MNKLKIRFIVWLLRRMKIPICYGIKMSGDNVTMTFRGKIAIEVDNDWSEVNRRLPAHIGPLVRVNKECQHIVSLKAA